MAEALLGRWKTYKNEGLDDYLKASDVGFATRAIIRNLTLEQEFLKEGEDWTIKTYSTFKNGTTVFKLGVPIDEENINGKKVKSTFTVEGSSMVETQEATGKIVPSRITNEVTADGEMLQTMVALPSNTTAKYWYKKVSQ